MTSQQSKSIGGQQLLKAAVYIFLVFEIAMLYIETRGDFANGMLFFIQGQLNGFFSILILLYFCIMYLLGRSAGYIILSKEKKQLFTGLLYGIMATLLIVCLPALPMFLLRSHDFNYTNNEILKITFLDFAVLFVPMTLTWLWSAHKIKAKEMT